ncbi:hypothetical protein [Escherichia albertii]|uniref:hypothetical protein n=1 Tax=Escherichia albertii TaxID=208962 RepID=UPI0011EDF4DE|nr:hypothetical protein [Escherichia albertii]EFO1595197.1 hypothetical protein [Escherichia coli]
MTTITKEFTKEQLIEQAKTRMEANRYLLTRLPPESATVKEVAMNLAIDEIALASLVSAPVAWLVGGRLFTTEIAAGMYASEVRKAVKPLFFSTLL